MSKMHWSLIDDLQDFDLGKSDAQKGVWRDSDALCFEGEHCFPVLLREPLPMDSFLLQAEIACTPESFAGLVFGAAGKLTLEVQANAVSAYIGEDSEPKLAIANLKHGRASGGKIGVWGSSPSFIRNLSVEKIESPSHTMLKFNPYPREVG